MADSIPPHNALLLGLAIAARRVVASGDDEARRWLGGHFETWASLEVEALPEQLRPLGERLVALGDLARRVLAGDLVERSDLEACALPHEGMVLGGVEPVRILSGPVE